MKRQRTRSASRYVRGQEKRKKDNKGKESEGITPCVWEGGTSASKQPRGRKEINKIKKKKLRE